MKVGPTERSEYREIADRRKTIPAPAKVYTNKDLGAVPPGPPPPAETPAASSEAAKSADKDKTDNSCSFSWGRRSG